MSKDRADRGGYWTKVAVAYHLQEDQCHLMSLSPEETQSCGGKDGKERPRQPLALSWLRLSATGCWFVGYEKQAASHFLKVILGSM